MSDGLTFIVQRRDVCGPSAALGLFGDAWRWTWDPDEVYRFATREVAEITAAKVADRRDVDLVEIQQ